MAPSRAAVERALHYVIAGGLWGGLALLLGRRAFGERIWAGVVAAPAIGLVVGLLTHPIFARVHGARRWLIATLSLYLGVTMFALPMAAYTALAYDYTPRGAWVALEEVLLGVWWGTTMTGFFLGLVPLAYLTHIVQEWRDR